MGSDESPPSDLRHIWRGGGREIRHSEFPRSKEAKIAKTTHRPQYPRLIVAQLTRDTNLLKLVHDSRSHW